ncbi:MAG TPA: DUF4352 domain-containing protein [Pseudonocardiaceae bacterium]|nr:DUF4352 domain-containing protein [Pseudonocardiaceae bacterium]
MPAESKKATMSYPAGYQQQQPTPPAMVPKKHRKWPWVLLGLVVVIVIIVVTTSNSGSKPSVSDSSGSRVHIGQSVRDGKFQFTITSVSTTKSVGDVQNGLGDTAQGQFVILHLTVQNIGDQAQALDDGSQYIYDSQSRKYSASTPADIDLSGAGSANTWLQDINPGNTVQGQMAFDMPTGTVADHAELHDSPFSGGVTVALR